MAGLRKPFFVAALVLMAIAVLIELGAAAILQGPRDQVSKARLRGMFAGDPARLTRTEREIQAGLDEVEDSDLNRALSQDEPPGLGIPYLALVDGLLLFTVALMGASLLLRERIHARVQGCTTLGFSCLMLLAALGLTVVAFAALIVMVALFLAVPFGTIAYLSRYGFFDRGGASVALGLVMTLKIAFVICLVLAHQRFLQNVGLVLLTLTSLIGTLIVGFLHGLVPGFLVSITDAIAAIILAVLAIIWALVLFILSLPATLKALRIDRV